MQHWTQGRYRPNRPRLALAAVCRAILARLVLWQRRPCILRRYRQQPQQPPDLFFSLELAAGEMKLFRQLSLQK